MPVIIPVGTAQAVIRYQADGDPEEMINVFGVALNADIDDTVVNAFMDAWCDNVLSAIWAGVYHCVGVTFQAGVTGGGVVPVESTNPPFTQGTGGSYVPQAAAYLVHKTSASPGQGGRGRVYVPGVLESAVNNVGQVDSAVVGDINTGLAGFRTDVAAIPEIDDLLILHSTGASGGPNAITGLSCDPVMATQRRRLRR